MSSYKKDCLSIGSIGPFKNCGAELNLRRLSKRFDKKRRMLEFPPKEMVHSRVRGKAATSTTCANREGVIRRSRSRWEIVVGPIKTGEPTSERQQCCAHLLGRPRCTRADGAFTESATELRRKEGREKGFVNRSRPILRWTGIPRASGNSGS